MSHTPLSTQQVDELLRVRERMLAEISADLTPDFKSVLQTKLRYEHRGLLDMVAHGEAAAIHAEVEHKKLNAQYFVEKRLRVYSF